MPVTALSRPPVVAAPIARTGGPQADSAIGTIWHRSRRTAFWSRDAGLKPMDNGVKVILIMNSNAPARLNELRAQANKSTNSRAFAST
jgi:hypothetical protein